MNQYIHIIKKSPLFHHIEPKDIHTMLNCLSATSSSYEKGHFILHAGDTTGLMGMVLTGSVLIVKEDFWGSRTILSEIPPGGLFAETYACYSSIPLQVSVVASGHAAILFLDPKKIMNLCSSKCTFHSTLIKNLVLVLAEKNLLLTRKMDHITQRSTREKLLSYLSGEAQGRGGGSFKIPFNRQELADYLSVDRSALSSELSKMQKEGILKYNKNQFWIYRQRPQ